MPEFDLDHIKKTWQQEVQPKYDSQSIETMLNKSSRNYVKFILWISIAEFLLILGLNIYYSFFGDYSGSFINILGKLGVKNSTELQANFAHLYFVLKTISLLLTGVFVVLFYQKYKKINVESNLKKFILQIISFKKIVNTFIIANIALLVVFTAVLTVFTFRILAQQNIHLSHLTLIGFITGIIGMTLISTVLIWLYYRVVYGIVMKRLEGNLNELQNMERLD